MIPRLPQREEPDDGRIEVNIRFQDLNDAGTFDTGQGFFSDRQLFLTYVFDQERLKLNQQMKRRTLADFAIALLLSVLFPSISFSQEDDTVLKVDSRHRLTQSAE